MSFESSEHLSIHYCVEIKAEKPDVSDLEEIASESEYDPLFTHEIKTEIEFEERIIEEVYEFDNTEKADERTSSIV